MNMKKIIYIVSLCLCAVVLFACTPQEERGDDQLADPAPDQDTQTVQGDSQEAKQEDKADLDNQETEDQTEVSEASEASEASEPQASEPQASETQATPLERQALTAHNWIRQESGQYFDDMTTLYLFEDGTFASNDAALFNQASQDGMLWFTGRYTYTGSDISFDLEEKAYPDYDQTAGQMRLVKTTIEAEDSESVQVTLPLKMDDAKNHLIVGDMTFKVDETHQPLLGDNDGESGDANDESAPFKGDWSRTNVHSAQWGDVTILDETANYIYFSGDVGNGANMGSFAGLARKINDREAVYYYEYSNSDQALVYVDFKRQGDLLMLESNAYSGDLGLGFNVFVDGEYTQGPVTYTNGDALSELMSEDQVAYVKDFLGDSAWAYLKAVIDYGYHYDQDGVSFSGFISGAGQGGDFIIDEDNHFNYLSYGEGPSQIFYTNQAQYQQTMPKALLAGLRMPDDMAFVYKHDQETTRIDQYVLLLDVEAYQIPNDTIQWGQVSEGNPIMIYSKGELSKVTYKGRKDQSKGRKDQSRGRKDQSNEQEDQLVYETDPTLPIVLYGGDLSGGTIEIEDKMGHDYSIPLKALETEGSYFLGINEDMSLQNEEGQSK